MPKEFTKLATRKNLFYKVTGKDDEGRELFHFVKVDPVKKELFLHDKEKIRMDVARYAEVLLSGYGTPDQEAQRFMQENYNISIDIG